MVDVVWGVPGDTGVPMLDVVPGKEFLAEQPSVVDRAELVGEVGPVLEGLEVRLGVGIVVGGVRPGVGLGHGTEAPVGVQATW
jgi:hypothetical protein